MSAEGTELKEEQLPPQEEGGEEDVRGSYDARKIHRNNPPRLSRESLRTIY